MRVAVLVALAGMGACTLVESQDGLVGPPLDAGSGLDGSGASDGRVALDDGDATGPVGADGAAEAGPLDATSPDSALDSPADAPVDSPSPGDGGPTTLYAQRISPLGLTVFDGTVCWVEGDSTRFIACAPAGGGSAAQVTTVASQTSDPLVEDAFDVALDATYVYWSNGPKNQVVRKPVAGGASAQYFTGDQQLSYIVLDGTRLWASDYVAGATSGNIVVGPGSGGVSSNLIFPAETQAAGVAVYSGSAYWGRNSPASVSLGLESGNVSITRIPTAGRVTGLALDAAGTAYFLSGNQQVYRLQQGSSTPVLVYDEGASFGDSDLAVDTDFIYWTEHDLGRILRLPR